MKQHPYYNRPSLQTSYQIAVISLIGLVLLIMIMKVSEVVNDFDNTYNKTDDDSYREMMIDGEVCSSLPFNYIKYRMMEGSILRAMNEQRASNEITSNV